MGDMASPFNDLQFAKTENVSCFVQQIGFEAFRAVGEDSRKAVAQGKLLVA